MEQKHFKNIMTMIGKLKEDNIKVHAFSKKKKQKNVGL